LASWRPLNCDYYHFAGLDGRQKRGKKVNLEATFLFYSFPALDQYEKNENQGWMGSRVGRFGYYIPLPLNPDSKLGKFSGSCYLHWYFARSINLHPFWYEQEPPPGDCRMGIVNWTFRSRDAGIANCKNQSKTPPGRLPPLLSAVHEAI
jgi:hypothetical protein